MLGFNDTSTLEGHFVSSPRGREKRDRRESRGDEREGQGRKRNRNESEETEEIKTFPSTLTHYKDSRPCPTVSQYQLDNTEDQNQSAHIHIIFEQIVVRIHAITKTCLYNFEPLKPHFNIVKLGFTGVYIIFLIFALKHRLWVLVRIASPTIYVFSRNMKNIRTLSENFQFLQVKFSIYLNGSVFVMVSFLVHD